MRDQTLDKLNETSQLGANGLKAMKSAFTNMFAKLTVKVKINLDPLEFAYSFILKSIDTLPDGVKLRSEITTKVSVARFMAVAQGAVTNEYLDLKEKGVVHLSPKARLMQEQYLNCLLGQAHDTARQELRRCIVSAMKRTPLDVMLEQAALCDEYIKFMARAPMRLEPVQLSSGLNRVMSYGDPPGQITDPLALLRTESDGHEKESLMRGIIGKLLGSNMLYSFLDFPSTLRQYQRDSRAVFGLFSTLDSRAYSSTNLAILPSSPDPNLPGHLKH